MRHEAPLLCWHNPCSVLTSCAAAHLKPGPPSCPTQALTPHSGTLYLTVLLTQLGLRYLGMGDRAQQGTSRRPEGGLVGAGTPCCLPLHKRRLHEASQPPHTCAVPPSLTDALVPCRPSVKAVFVPCWFFRFVFRGIRFLNNLNSRHFSIPCLPQGTGEAYSLQTAVQYDTTRVLQYIYSFGIHNYL